jgi:YesN/AraC family two-component response regulator
MSEGQILTITPKQYYQFLLLSNVKGHILEFTYDFFCKDAKTVELIYHNGLYCHFALNELIQVPDDAARSKVEYLFSEINKEAQTCFFEYEASVHSLVKLLMIEVSRFKIIQQNGPLYTPDALFLKFLNLVRDNFSKRLSIAQYAELLAITETKLNELSKKNTGETSQQLVNDLIILEAKRLLNYNKLSIKQIAFELGFDDPYYFSRFFKKQTSTRASDHLKKTLLGNH